MTHQVQDPWLRDDPCSDAEESTFTAEPPSDLAGREAMAALHADVDAAVDGLRSVHASRLQCRHGCNACCVDDLTVFEVEAELIVHHHAELLATAAPHAIGACAFLDGDGGCRIYEQRPYVCRTQGLPLRWAEERDGETVELRDICGLNEAGDPIETLPADHCWTVGPVEQKLAQLQLNRGSSRRRSLRGLFAERKAPIDGAET